MRDDVEVLEIEGLNYPLYINSHGIACTISGMGKVFSALTLTSLIKHRNLDLSDCKIIVVGCCGGIREYSQIGQTYLVDHSIDFDLGHHFEPCDTLNNQIFLPFDDFEQSVPSYFNLKSSKYNIIPLVNQISSKPCISLSSDNYWHGETQNMRAFEVIRKNLELRGLAEVNLEDYNIISQFEDHAYATICQQFKIINQLIILRSVVNYTSFLDVPADLSVKKYDKTEFMLAMQDNFKCIETIINCN